MRRTFLAAFAVLVCFLCVAEVRGQESATTANPSSSVAPASSGSVPRLIRFSGTLRDQAGKPLSGPMNVSFSIFAEREGGSPLWWETQTVEVDAQGRYSVLLGAMQPDGVPMELFTSGKARWLEVLVEGGVTPTSCAYASPAASDWLPARSVAL